MVEKETLIGEVSCKLLRKNEKVVHLDGWFDNPLGDFRVEDAILAPLGERVVALRDTPREVMEGVEVVLVRAAKVDRSVLARLPRCRVIIRYGIGTDSIDLAEATRRGVEVCNVPDFCTAEMADHTLMLALVLLRRFPAFLQRARDGEWSLKGEPLVHDFSTLRWVAIGYGRIAREVLRRAQVFGFRTGAVDPAIAPQIMAQSGVEALPWEAGLAGGNLLSLHCPLTQQTSSLMDADAFAGMKPGAMLVNTARGGLVETGALVEALRSGRLGGAALDTTTPEPLPREHPLFAMSQVVITPHMAWYSREAQTRLRQGGAREAARALRGEALLHRINIAGSRG